jgi:hypothetical protein
MPTAHVPKDVVAENKQDAGDRPSIVVTYDDGTETLCHEAEIPVPSRLVARPNAPRRTGAIVYVEAETIIPWFADTEGED